MIMKTIKLFFIITAITCLFGCSEDSLDPNSIFNTDPTEQNEFDKWIMQHYTKPFNVQFNYRYDANEIDNRYNLVPAEYNKSIALAKMIRYVWIDSYSELCGENFIKTYCPRLLQLVGSVAYDSQGSMILGSAEGGKKITLYNVNSIDIDNPDLEMLNFWFFKTMHHEFGHILQQNKNYSTDFNLISASDYRAGDWVNLKDENAPQYGFVSGYASKEANEDFVEILSIYVTNTETYWEDLLDAGGEDGASIILAKFDIVKTYLKNSWKIEIDDLREIVLRRSAEINTLDLKSLN